MVILTNRIIFYIRLSDIQYFFEYVMKKDETLTHNPSIKKYINKIGNKSTENKDSRDKNGEDVPHLEITELILVHCNNKDYVNNNNNDYQQNLRVLYTFVPNKLLGQLLDISPTSLIFLKTFNSEFSYVKV